MKIAAFIGTVLLGLLLTCTAFARPDHGRGEDDHGARNDHARGHEQEHGRGSREQGPRQQYDHRDRGNRPEHFREERHDQPQVDRRGPAREHMRPANWHEDEHRRGDIWAVNRSHDWKREHHSWRERGGYHGYRIPEDRFHTYFGRGHWFRVHSVPVIVVDGRPRFQYAGFWFTMVEPWPEYWAPTWYQTDDVYVDYVNDGYYLCNRSHPGVSVAVNVSF